MSKQEALDRVSEVVTEQGVCELPAVSSWASTGCTVLDLAISNRFPGGIPIGRITHIFGAESTAKTVLGMTILGDIQRKGGIAFFADVENTFDPEWAKLFGLNCLDSNIWCLGYPRTIEEYFDDYLKSIIRLDDNRSKVIVTDSLSAMPSEAEVDANMKDGTYGTSRAKQMSQGFRKYIRPIAESKVSLVFIDQTRDNVGVVFGEKETVSGGRALKFYSSVRLHLYSGDKVKNKREQDVGIWIDFRVDKNKTAPPYRHGRFRILWDYGIDNIASNLNFLKEHQKDEDVDIKPGRKRKKKSGRILFDDVNKFMEDMILHVEKNNLEDVLDKEVSDLWFEIYKTDPRKKRSW